jgi:hypothetical protein
LPTSQIELATKHPEARLVNLTGHLFALGGDWGLLERLAERVED